MQEPTSSTLVPFLFQKEGGNSLNLSYSLYSRVIAYLGMRFNLETKEGNKKPRPESGFFVLKILSSIDEAVHQKSARLEISPRT